MAEMDFNRRTGAFLDWFKALPGSTFHNDIAICDLRGRGAGRGIVATADIEPETVLFTIPRRAVICPETSELAARAPEIFSESFLGDRGENGQIQGEGSEAPVPLSVPWASLILIMMYEYLRGDKSPWKPYLDVLPNTFETPMFWSEDEMRELQASSVAQRTARQEADLMFRSRILPVIHARRDLFFSEGVPPLDDGELLKLAHQVASAIMSYSFELETDEEEENEGEDDWVEDKVDVMLGMVPMADILNADADFNAHINHEEGVLTATALRPIKAGQEILNYYGPLPNGQLLRRYGYTTPFHSRYDDVELPAHLLVSALGSRLGLTLDQTKDVAESIDNGDLGDAFVLEQDLDPPDSTGRLPDILTVYDLQELALPEELEEQAKAFLKAAKKLNLTGSIGVDLDRKEKRREIVLAAAGDALAARLAQYGTTIEEDRAILADAGISRRRRMAVEVRMGEKALLLAAHRGVTTALAQLAEQVRQEAVTAERPPKRQRLSYIG